MKLMPRSLRRLDERGKIQYMADEVKTYIENLYKDR